MQSKKDSRFEEEVRGCLKEQLLFISELQSDIESDQTKMMKELKDVRWQIQMSEN